MNDPFIGKVNKLTFFMIILCILGLLFMPLFPWISTEVSKETYYAHEGDLIRGRKSMEDAKDSLDDASDYVKDTDEYKDAKDLVNAGLGLIDNISGVGFYFWLALIFAIIVFIGVGIYKMGQKYQLFGHLLFLSSILVLIFSILITLNHVFLLGNIGTYNDKIKDFQGIGGYFGTSLFSGEITFSFNYIPLIMGILLLIISLIFVIKILPFSLRSVTATSRQNRPSGYQQQSYGGPYQQQGQPPQQMPAQTPPPQPKQQPSPPPQQQPPEQKTGDIKFCPGCGTKIEGKIKFCPKCGKKII